MSFSASMFGIDEYGLRQKSLILNKLIALKTQLEEFPSPASALILPNIDTVFDAIADISENKKASRHALVCVAQLARLEQTTGITNFFLKYGQISKEDKALMVEINPALGKIMSVERSSLLERLLPRAKL